MTGDLIVALALLAGVCAVCALGAGVDWLMDRIDERRAPTALTRSQLVDRGAPPWPFDTWDEVWPGHVPDPTPGGHSEVGR